jgi:two-component system, OmpR family, phosphate regulon sensor histidine kinase PhoR
VKLGIRAKLFFASLVLIAVSLLTGEMYLRPTIEHDLVERIRADLSVRLALVAEEARVLASRADPTSAAWDELADRLGPLARARVTFIDRLGVVRGDSDLSGTALERLENHGSRPEVLAALAGRNGDSVRYSGTLKYRLLYSAAPVPAAGGMVARLSLPLSNVDQAVARLRTILFVGGLLALLVALLLSSAAAVLLSRALRQVTALARRMAAGELDLRSHMHSHDEVGELARVLDHLAENLSRSMRELRHDRDLLGRILESIREGLLVLDNERRILLFNASLRETLLLDASAVGRPAIEVVRNAELHALVETALAGQEAVSGEIEVGGLRPRRLMVHATQIPGEPSCILVVLFDVTELRRLEIVRKDFVANVSHELRTPIAAVRSAAETLQTVSESDPAAARSFVDIIERNARRLGDLAQEILDLSQIEAREFRLAKDRFDLAGVVSRTMELHAERATAKRMQIKTEFSANLPSVCGDATAMERVLSNLIDNAIKYCPEGARVVVAAEDLGGKLRVTVCDDGQGIEPQHLPRLFERFYRCDPGRSRAMGGTGLGLSIVKHLVEAMGGTIQVESTPGQGTRFSFSVPTVA